MELVRERAFHALERRLSPRVKSALVEYVRALGRLGKGTGKGAGRHRRVARDAMARCYDAVPCWIMPPWRVAEQLPSDMSAFDLVILDEASQSDVTELPALLRGRKILAVGDDRQVSPTPPFVSQGAVAQLRHRYLRDLPYAALLEPGGRLLLDFNPRKRSHFYPDDAAEVFRRAGAQISRSKVLVSAS